MKRIGMALAALAAVAAGAAPAPVSAIETGPAAAGAIGTGPAPAGATVGLSDQDASSFSDTVDLHPQGPLFPRTAAEIALWDKLRADLQVRSGRRLVPWNLCYPGCSNTGPVDQWVSNVEAEGMTPELVLQGSGTTKKAPSPAVYRAAFAALVAHFDAVPGKAVPLWGAWLEPNEPANLVAPPHMTVDQGAARAADYWREAQDFLNNPTTGYCVGHAIAGCTVAAGEFADPAGGFYSPGGYIYEYGKEVLNQGNAAVPYAGHPAVWAAHAFVDLENGWRTRHVPYKYPRDLKYECATARPGTRAYLQPDIAWRERHGYAFQQVDCYANYFAGTANNGWDMGAFWHHPVIWLDAEGAVMDNGVGLTPLDAAYTKTAKDPRPRQLDPNYPAPLGDKLAARRQVDAAREFLAFRTRYDALVERIDYFDWGPGPVGTSGFDAALLDWYDKPRPAYCALTATAASKCPGVPSSVKPRLGPTPPHPPPCSGQCI